MAEQYAILVAGQSQGAKVGEITKFEDKCLDVSPRNPSVYGRSATVSKSHGQDTFTMAGTWPDKYKSFSVRGTGTTAVLRLTPYNPTASYYEARGAASDAKIQTAYPGYARAKDTQSSQDRTSLDLLAEFQATPVGKKLTRISTGVEHTVSVWGGSSNRSYVEVTEPFDPPIQPGELFKLPLYVSATGNALQFSPNVRFGGYTDTGNSRLGAIAGPTHSINANVTGLDCARFSATVLVGTAGDPIKIQCNSQHMVPGMRLEFTDPTGAGNIHVDLPDDTEFYVTRVDLTAGAPAFYVSASRFGAEVTYTADNTAADNGYVARVPQSVGTTMAGLQVRFTSGDMAGQTFPLTDNFQQGSASWDLRADGGFTSNPQANDTFEIEPQRINNEAIDWDEYALFMPETTISGVGYGAVNCFGKFTLGTTADPIVVTLDYGVYEGMRLVLYDYEWQGTTRTVASGQGGGLTTGTVVYAKNVNYALKTCELSLTYGGASIVGTISPAGSGLFDFIYAVSEHPDRGNPAPPGFNHDTTHALPEFDHTSYFGEPLKGLIVTDPNASMTTSLARAMHEYTGRVIHVINTNVPATSLARRESFDGPEYDVHSWYDRQVFLDWAPGESDNCYARTVKMLRAAKRAAAAKGDTLKIVGVFFLQGEMDGSNEEYASRYKENLKSFAKTLREEIVAQGMWSGPAETLPWWQPNITVNPLWPYEKTINAAITELSEEDDYFTTNTVTDLSASYDTLHYRGDSLFELGLKAFNSWKLIAPDPDDRTRVDICNQALKNLGQTRVITSLTEDTAAAKLCNRYYEAAVTALLEGFPWSFAVKTTTLTEKSSNDRLTVDWKHAYELPANFLSVVTLGPDLAGATVDQEVTFAVEGDTLYTDLADATLRYTQRSPDPRKYSQHFTNALAYQLAADIAPGLFQGEQGIALAQNMMQLSGYHVDLARQHMGQRLRNAQEESNNYAWD